MTEPPKHRHTGKVQGGLAFLIIFGFFGNLWFLMAVQTTAPMKEVLLVMVGALGAAFTAVVSFYFGSSAGSQAKDVLLGKKDT